MLIPQMGSVTFSELVTVMILPFITPAIVARRAANYRLLCSHQDAPCRVPLDPGISHVPDSVQTRNLAVLVEHLWLSKASLPRHQRPSLYINACMKLTIDLPVHWNVKGLPTLAAVRGPWSALVSGSICRRPPVADAPCDVSDPVRS